ncbi:MAG: hypothetical protein C5B52_16415 [Bacteroidetes bacterium]|nr:MAG: hypothetical protein C5B52_16415 [Bacteroidota bacterium]
MKKLLLVIFLFSIGHIQAQDTLRRYFDETLLPTDKKHAVYEALVTRAENHYQALVLYKSGNVFLKGEYKDKSLFIRNGLFELFNENGTGIFSVIYDENKINGVFKRWNATGTLADSGMIRNNHCEGEWRGYHKNGQPAYRVNYIGSNYFQPELPSQLDIARFLSVAGLTNFQIYAVPDGKYYEWYENGRLKDSCEFAKGKKTGQWRSWYVDGKPESEGKYMNDSCVGVWNWYHSTGELATREVYRDGKLSDLACYDSLGTPTGFTCALMTRPHPTADSVEGSFEDYLIANLYYPREALTKGIEGMVSLEFVIGKDGRLKSINIISSPSDLLSEEVVRLLKSVPKWAPAISHNRPVDFVYEFNVPFRIPD